MTVTSRVKIINPYTASQVALASDKYVFSVTGIGNQIDVNSNGSNMSRLVKCESGSKYNKVHYKNSQPAGSQQPLLDLGTYNSWQIGEGDWMQGNANGGMCASWSDFPVQNLITRSIDFNDLTLDGLTRAIDNTIRGPNNKGGVYKFDTPVGNRQLTQSIGSTAANTCFAMSFWIKAVTGGETSTVEACLSESPSSDYATITITSTQWTRVLILRKFSTGSFTRYFAIRLPVAHGGVYLYGPQVVNLGDNATSGESSPAYWGGYVPTNAAIRTDPSPRDPHRFQRAAPTGGLWYLGDRVIDLTCAAGAASPGLVCITDGEPGTWKAEAVVSA